MNLSNSANKMQDNYIVHTWWRRELHELQDKQLQETHKL